MFGPFNPRPLRAFSLALSLLPCVMMPVIAQDGDLAEKLFRSGENAYARKSYKEALDTWNQLLQSSPSSEFAPQALFRMAKHQVEIEQKPDAAMPLLDKLKSDYIKTPWAADGILLRGTLIAQQARRPGDLRDAIAEFNRVVDLFPEHIAVPEARYRLGRAARDQGQMSKALAYFVESFRNHPDAVIAPQAMLEAAEALDASGDLNGCLRLLQRIRQVAPQSSAATEAGWRITVRVKHRLQKGPFKLEGPWPAGKTKWLKTPTLLATSSNGELFIYQSDLDRAFKIQGNEAQPAGPTAASAKAMAIGPKAFPWLISTKTGINKDEGATPLGNLNNPTGAAFDRWNGLWVSDAKTSGFTIFAPEGGTRGVAGPVVNALASMPNGGFVAAADANRSLLFLDANGQPRLNVPYGKELPASFKEVLALATDATGHVAALVDGGDFGEGIVLFGPDGAVLRQGTLKSLNLSGRFTSLALDRSGGIILCDRRNDTLFRVF
jgi:TolA-binding protein